MTDIEAVHRTRVLVGIGVLMLTLAAAQFATGKTFEAYAPKPFTMISRKKNSIYFGRLLPHGVYAAYFLQHVHWLGFIDCTRHYFRAAALDESAKYHTPQCRSEASSEADQLLETTPDAHR